MKCPYLEAEKSNYCEVPQTQIEPSLGEIKIFCISEEFVNCPIFPDQSQKSVQK